MESMKELLPYFSVILAVGGMIFAMGRKDKGYESTIFLIESKIHDIQADTIPRLHRKIEKLSGSVDTCVRGDSLTEFKATTHSRFDKLDRDIEILNGSINKMCMQITRLETKVCNGDAINGK